MGKVKNIIEKWTTKLKDRLHKKKEAFSPKTRLRIVLAAFVVFAALCLYMTATAITGFGKGERALEIRHIEKLDLHGQENMNRINTYRNGNVTMD